MAHSLGIMLVSHPPELKHSDDDDDDDDDDDHHHHHHLWDMQVHTDKMIKANKPDIIIKDKQEKTCMLIDMAIPSDRNTSVKVAEKLSKYKDLEIEITKMWGLKTITVPVVIGALGVVTKGIKKHIDKIPGKINITELQNIALLGSSHIL